MLGIPNICARRLLGVYVVLRSGPLTHHVDFVAAFQNHTNFSRKNMCSILEPLKDCSPTFEIFERLQKIVDAKARSGSFWFQFLDTCTELDRPMLANAAADFVASAPFRHSKAAVMKVLELFAAQSRFTEFRSLFDLLHSGLTAPEKVVFALDLIRVLSQTPYYKETLNILPLIEKRHRNNALRYICEGAAKFDSTQSALTSLSELDTYHPPPTDSFFVELLAKLPTKEGYSVMNSLLEIIRTKHWIISESSAGMIASWFNSQDAQVYTATMGIRIMGTMCPACKNKLPVFQMSEHAVTSISKEFYQRAFKGEQDEHLYLTTTPKELDSLEKFLESQDDRFDCVIDFLNVMHQLCVPFEPKMAGRVMCEILQTFKREFNFKRFCLVSKGNVVIRHPTFMAQVKELGNKLGISVFTFITQNKSEDDIFTIYIALWSGPRCYLVSNDEFKQHRFIVGSQLGFQIFRWQSIRQIGLSPGRHGTPLVPLQCDTCVHGCGDSGWHIPYDDKSPRKSYVPPNLWLCVRLLRPM
ncbi:unnamed protein product [Dicrocoelium dendriticum]|nr:unnamed protein product [Dicrocoelium dendriticum]